MTFQRQVIPPTLTKPGGRSLGLVIRGCRRRRNHREQAWRSSASQLPRVGSGQCMGSEHLIPMGNGESLLQSGDQVLGAFFWRRGPVHGKVRPCSNRERPSPTSRPAIRTGTRFGAQTGMADGRSSGGTSRLTHLAEHWKGRSSVTELPNSKRSTLASWGSHTTLRRTTRVGLS